MLQIPGTYHILAGRLPFPEAMRKQVRAQAEARLAALGPYRSDVPSRLLDHGGGRLQRTVRLLCTDVWPTLYRILALRMRDPMDVWRLPKEDAMALLPEIEPAGRDIRRFYDSVIEYYPAQDSVSVALAAIERGIAFLDSARAWHRGLEADAV